MEQGIINFAVYEDGNEYMGLASVTLPDTTYPVSYTHLTLPTICSV